MSPFPLNKEQQQAVHLDPNTNALILSGAGTGKTRVIIERLVYLIREQNIHPAQVLAVTFTNKAAREMKRRLEEALGEMPMGLWLGTFHNIAHRMLRQHAEAAGLNPNFTIIDSEDQQRLIRRLTKDLEIDEKVWPIAQTQSYISRQKEETLRAKDIKTDPTDLQTQNLARLYQAYEDTCKANDWVDFSEILLGSFELLKNNADILASYQQKFSFIHIDEFQDTNHIQYRWIKLFQRQGCAFMAVGDDDQSIYGWRGARIDNIHQFEKDFAPVELVRLEQNYRSTQNILTAANALIDNNNTRLGKKLWTEGDKGDLITLYRAINEVEEANYLAEQIQKQLSNGIAYQDQAILYRSNAQSRVIEEALIKQSIPYRIYGGMRFFERAEIKDALAYLKIIAQPNDNGAFERIINIPARGIGEKTLMDIRKLAQDRSLSMLEATTVVVKEQLLSSRATNALVKFLDLMGELQTACQDKTLSETMRIIIKLTELPEFYLKQPGEKGQIRVENLNELVTATEQFIPSDIDEGLSTLDSFLAHAYLNSADVNEAPDENAVQLMTIHAAKGLEFDCVYLSGMEDELFPPRFATLTDKRLEEERRLCYVAMTRAKRYLTMTYAQLRRIYAESRSHSLSRFVAEIPEEFMNKATLSLKVTQPITQSYAQPKRRKTLDIHSNALSWKIGQRVRHAKFGMGIVIGCEGNGDDARVSIHFSDIGVKVLAARIAKLEPLE